MTVSFDNIPSDVRTPGHFVEIDATAAVEGSGTRPHKALIIAYRFNGGTATDGSGVTFPTGTVGQNEARLVTRASDAQGFFGIGSQAAVMAEAFLRINERTPLYVMGVDDPAGTSADGTVTFTASSPAAGVVAVYVGGTRYQVSVATDSTATTLATDLVSLVNADAEAPVTASSTAGVTTLTAKHPGPEGNTIDVRVGYRETDSLPAGVTAVAASMSGGATSPDITAAITAMAGTQYDTIILGFADDANLSLLEDELADRWTPMVNLDGHCFYGLCENQSDTTTALASRNSEHTTAACMGLSPTLPWVAAAQMAAHDAAVTTDDPARPRTTLALRDVLAPEPADRWTQPERNGVLLNGGATAKPDATNGMQIERVTTTYKTNAQGAEDPTWFDLSTKRTVSLLRWSWDNRITRKFPRHKLADDGTNFDPGQAVVTPSTIRAEAIAWFSENEGLGLVENLDQFREDLIVERNTTDLNRIDAILRPDTINKFVVSATKLQFRL